MMALTEAGVMAKAIAMIVQRSTCTVYRWLEQDKSASAANVHRAGCSAVYDQQTQLRMVAFYCQTRPFTQAGQWSLRYAACYLQHHPQLLDATPSKSTLHRALQNNRLKPHLSRYFLHITDPNFFPKMEHLLALYAAAPQYLFFFDECPGIQVLSRLTPDLQTDTTRHRLKEFEYIRNGTMDVFAFLSQHDGSVAVECHADHTTQTFLDVFERHAERFAHDATLHYVMDNLSSHRSYPFCQLVAKLSRIACPPEQLLKTQSERAAWLQQDHKRIVIHFTPFHGSWLNQVEIWFGIMKQKVLTSSFDDPAELKTAVCAFGDDWVLLLAHPFRWSYDGRGLHEKAVKRFADMLTPQQKLPDLRTLTKLMLLTTNLLNDYLQKIPTTTWDKFRTVFLSSAESIADLIEREKRPIQKKKAKNALDALNAVLTARIDQLKQNDAA